ncbi:ribosome silencing factor [Alphaproteobacteria bacterium]|nr:ribosome silencing factor [Pelagibacteraceae bacterium]MDB2348774.1 ribosome silencing factor [Alphaproteobacteria bacterium]MDC0342649.1 ribosome silencing factor [Alphaproteobacteria bacterium]MDC0624311.1 ribosome silencing factor [Alphaproteobacteria bacterium]MDC1054200.1 ribosome silencing factor [Alphaproteobacteria bacterium]
MFSILDDAKAEDIKIIDLRNKSSVADYFVISTCRSSRHADATADDLARKLKKLGFKNPSPEGRPKCDWVIVDAGSVIVHLFKKEIRELYNLEQLWEVNFESEKSKLAN